jgi:dGTPase
VDRFREFSEEIAGHFPGANERVRVYEVIRALINWLVSELIEGTIAAAGSLGSIGDVRTWPSRVARFTPEAARGAAQLKNFLRVQVYDSEELAASRRTAAARIVELFQLLMARPDYLPSSYREESAGQPLHHQVCDYIAGMTDGFFERTCKQYGIA